MYASQINALQAAMRKVTDPLLNSGQRALSAGWLYTVSCFQNIAGSLRLMRGMNAVSCEVECRLRWCT